ncbi:TPA: hypothetical protein N0F65_010401 [Lagenidium giganteum]|uniref:Uncharacterized protein n=1 Tax=Lagenidium giganteum TaxID=4803 RepID=A0AAV2YV32_9STRA|nr:TPA: hypothetical protein N0F65_010401 [Lagenidium giganteum]
MVLHDLTPQERRERRRERHRLMVRDHRLRKKTTQEYLRQQQTELEARLDEHLARLQPEDGTDVKMEEVAEVTSQLRLYVERVQEVRLLRNEQANLQQQLVMRDAWMQKIERYVHDFMPQATNSDCDIAEPDIVIEPLSEEEAWAIMIDSHHQAELFFQYMALLSPTDHIRDWMQHDITNWDGSVQFNLSKRLGGIRADELVEKSWKMYTDLDRYRGIYASVRRLDVLQQINDDAFVIRRDIKSSEDSPIFRSVFLLFRIKTERGYIICFRSHNPPMYVAEQELDPSVQWMEMFYWLMINEPETSHPEFGFQGCDVKFGGNLLNAQSAQHAKLWKIEIVMALLRWESNVVSPFLRF